MDQTNFRDLALAAQILHEMRAANLTLLHVLAVPKQRPQTLAESHIRVFIWAAPLLLCSGCLLCIVGRHYWCWSRIYFVGIPLLIDASKFLRSPPSHSVASHLEDLRLVAHG